MRESGVRCPECGARVRDADQQLCDLQRRLEDAGALHLADETTIRQLQRVVEAAKAIATGLLSNWPLGRVGEDIDDDEILALLDAVAALGA